jgi:two-component system sensor histidine kinase ChiS
MPQHILIIEDEQILRELISGELVKKGYIVSTASDGVGGWNAIQEKNPDLVLLDLLMPLMSGYDVLTKMRATRAYKKLPCIVISNSGQFDDLNRAYDCGANDVLIKADFNPDQVIEKIEQLFAKQKEEKKKEG